jgi:hypothetical protein
MIKVTRPTSSRWSPDRRRYQFRSGRTVVDEATRSSIPREKRPLLIDPGIDDLLDHIVWKPLQTAFARRDGSGRRLG